MLAGLGSRFCVTETAIKPYPVGYPIQAALDAFFVLHRAHGLTVDNVERIIVRLPTDRRGHRQRPGHARRELPAHGRYGPGGWGK